MPKIWIKLTSIAMFFTVYILLCHYVLNTSPNITEFRTPKNTVFGISENWKLETCMYMLQSCKYTIQNKGLLHRPTVFTFIYMTQTVQHKSHHFLCITMFFTVSFQCYTNQLCQVHRAWVKLINVYFDNSLPIHITLIYRYCSIYGP